MADDMPFLYTSMVGDMNPLAYDRLLTNYNFAGYPVAFFDGGDEVYPNAPPTEDYYRLRIEACGARTTPDLSLVTALDWLGGSQVRARLRIGNGVPANTAPADPSTPDGPSQAAVATEVGFDVIMTDNEADQMYCQWDWGNGEVSPWLGPYDANQTLTVYHQWSVTGDYDVRVRLLDVWNDSTAWSSPHSLAVSCCIGTVGKVVLDAGDNCSSVVNQGVDVGDLTNLIDHLFINFTPLCCAEESDVSPAIAGGTADGTIDVGDLTAVIDHLFINFPPMPACP